MSVPTKLLKMQKWFAATITQPLQPDNTLQAAQEEAARYIAPSPTLQPHQRIEIYHQQYWWRLLKVLHENFPTVTRLFGYLPFNEQIAIPYLLKHPPKQWALCELGQDLPDWIEKNYKGDDKRLVRSFAQIDAAAQKAFWVGNLPSMHFEPLENDQRLTTPIRLQPHVHLFELKGDLFSFREVFLQEEVNYWNDHPFPKMEYGKFYFALYRNPKNIVTWKKIDYGAYRLLHYLKKELTLAKACVKIEEEGGKAYEEAQELLSLWLFDWTKLKWFAKWVGCFSP
ncbi:MAG: DNA-binding domain-containing protein [Chlamydiales bacterium]